MSDDIVDLTNENDVISSSKKRKQNISSSSSKIWLVIHQKKPFYHGAFSYDSQLRYGPSSIDKVVVGAYTSLNEAEISCREYWNDLELVPDDDDPDSLVLRIGDEGFYYNSCENGGDSNDLDEQVFIEEHEVNKSPKISDIDGNILSRKGRN